MEDEVIVVTGEGGAITSLRTVISMDEVFWRQVNVTVEILIIVQFQSP